jgi:hypothetical protein
MVKRRLRQCKDRSPIRTPARLVQKPGGFRMAGHRPPGLDAFVSARFAGTLNMNGRSPSDS